MEHQPHQPSFRVYTVISDHAEIQQWVSDPDHHCQLIRELLGDQETVIVAVSDVHLPPEFRTFNAEALEQTFAHSVVIRE
jgi:hypothetical protein